MNKKDEEIQKKLQELEKTVLKETSAAYPPSTVEKDMQVLHTGSTTKDAPSDAAIIKNDLCYFGGIGLIILGFVLMFSWVRVQTGFLNLLGMGGQGFGLFMIPLVVGIGWLIYDSKSKIAMLLTGGTCVLMVLAILASLIMNFPAMSVMQLITMLAPFAIGGALLLKGVGGPKAVEEKLKKLKS